MEAQTLQLFITAIFVSISASLLGSFVILKKMALVGDALSHVALPGIALGLIFHFNPFYGAFAALLVAVIGVWMLKYRTNLPLDTLVGIFFTTSLALGILFIPEPDLLEIMFGNIAALSLNQAIISIVISILLIAAILIIHKKLTLSMLSEELANSIGIRTRRLEFIYLIIFALAVALGIRFVGVLLMGALVVIPPASAKNMVKSLFNFMLLSVIFGIIAAISGIYASNIFHLPPGPLFVLSSSVIFIFTLLYRWFKK
ncbi:MAG: metal ABC transporter permease [Patescibacteria group bacterium]|nr:metal ABC transporter permease [Patescibacteria group bacterium]